MGSWWTADAIAAYRFGETGHAWSDDLVVRASIVNVLDRDPPFANTAFGYDGANADPFGRLMSVQLTKSW